MRDRLIRFIADRAMPLFRVGEGEKQVFSALPAAFEAAAFGDWEIPHAAARLNDSRVMRALLSACGPEFNLVRGTLALRRGELVLARSLLERYRDRGCDTAGTIIAGMLVARLDMLPFDEGDLQTMALMREPAARMTEAQGPVLVVGDGATEAILPKLDFLGAGQAATVLTLHSNGKPPDDTPLRRHLSPPVFIWHAPDGRAAHTALDALASDVARHLCEAVPAMASMQDAVRFVILDLHVYKWLLLENLEALLAREPFGQIAVVTRSERFFQLVKAIAGRLQPEAEVFPVWDGLPPLFANPLRTLWPAISKRAARILSRVRGMAAPFVAEAACAPFILPETAAGSAPAVIGWLARDRNYMTGLERVLTATLAERPVILFLDVDDDEKVARLEAHAKNLNLPPDRYFLILRYSAFLDRAKQDLEKLGLMLGAATLAYAKGLGGETRALARDLCRIDLPTTLADYAHLRVVALVGEAVDRLLKTTKPAYGILDSARGATFAAIAERLARQDIPSMDVHTYLVGNHARQVAPPTRYVGVIDDQQEALVVETWGVPREDILRIGYIWRDRGEDTGPPPPVSQTARKMILICTQPGDPDMVEQFFSRVLEAIARDDRIDALLKPHPAEPASTLAAYEKTIAAQGLARRVSSLPASVPVSSLFDRADLVITRTSNVGIESALKLRPTIRYIEFDRYDPGVVSDVVYAANVLSTAELAQTINALLYSEKAKAAHRALQLDYMRENPAQARADGADRLVRFLEQHASRAPGATRRAFRKVEAP